MWTFFVTGNASDRFHSFQRPKSERNSLRAADSRKGNGNDSERDQVKNRVTEVAPHLVPQKRSLDENHRKQQVTQMTNQSPSKWRYLHAIVLTAILALTLARATVADTANFTRITSGRLVNDGGVSFGASWIDYDNDGWLDIYVGNQGSPGGQNNFLYHNEGDGSFTKITSGEPVNDGEVTYSHCWGDYDNDGDADLFVGRWYDHTNYLYANNGDGTFTRIDTAGDITTDPGYSTHHAWIDIDNDGDLDLYTQNEHETLPFSQANAMYRNDNGIFTKILTGEIVTDVYNSHGLGWSDYDNDGDMDLFVANTYNDYPGPTPYMQVNGLYRNDGDFAFAKIVSGPVATDVAISYGPSWADYDNDGDMDLYVANSGLPLANFLYSNNGDGSFSKVTTGEIVTAVEKTFTSSWADYDNDGDLDLFLTTYDDSNPRNRLYENGGDGTFTRITAGSIVNDEGSCWTAAWGDYDRDGDLDVYIAKPDPADYDNVLYRNDGNGNNWLNVTCIGTVSNASAIGAKVRVKATIFGEPVWQLREISPSAGYCVQHAIGAHFGLGDASAADSIRVEWPSGKVQILTGVAANQFLDVEENCCIPPTVGDADQSGAVDITDVSILVDNQFLTLTPLVCSEEGDIDFSGVVDITDLSLLIDNQFLTLTPLPSCP